MAVERIFGSPFFFWWLKILSKLFTSKRLLCLSCCLNFFCSLAQAEFLLLSGSYVDVFRLKD